ncbi:NAD(P)-dependent oxidoreductase [Novosphingobium sp. Gsoil 351]|uniref:NAD(P)-dependent oxidoreductase n=1 Tax=Novosphingobium sp. Gsoil 351 TaxID=2675225 RepID=UPI0012B47FB5|nr:NAD(P)-dependent oxidoreductase [Novosphingobium sp. Gsoil 351]QGN54415.1 siroheme synthase [Novosphingobium sp. Gsoil 351]
MHSLPLFHRIAGQPVIVLGEGAAAEAKARLVERAGGVIVGEDHACARLAFIAQPEPEPAAARLRARGVLVNVADRPDLCDFTLPSVLERGPVLLAVSTGGASAGLAKALRLRLETLLPATLGSLAEALAAAREAMRARWPDAAARRGAIDAALAEGGALDPLAGYGESAIEHWLSGEGTAPGPVTVEIVLRSDDPDDLTLREARLLGTADVIRHSCDVPPAILIRARADAERWALDDPRPDHGRTVILKRT